MSALEIGLYGIAIGVIAFGVDVALDYLIHLPPASRSKRAAGRLTSQGCDERGDGAADGSNPLPEFTGVGLSGLSRDELIEKLTVLLIEFMHLADHIGESVEDVELRTVASFDLVKAERESLNAVGEAIKGLSDDLRAERLRRGHVSSLVEDGTERVAQ